MVMVMVMVRHSSLMHSLARDSMPQKMEPEEGRL